MRRAEQRRAQFALLLIVTEVANSTRSEHVRC